MASFEPRHRAFVPLQSRPSPGRPQAAAPIRPFAGTGAAQRRVHAN